MSATSLKIRTPAELIAVLPYMMGYHPSDAVAVVGFTGHRVDFGACHPLPPPDYGEQELREATAAVAQTVSMQGASSVVVIGFGPATRVTPAVMRATRELQAVGVRVEDVLRVTGDRWWSYLCPDPACCSPEGMPCLPPDSVIAAEATYRGHVALPRREDVVAQVEPVAGPDRAEMVAATERARRRFDELLDPVPADRYARTIRSAGRIAVRGAEKRYRSGGTLDADGFAWLGVLLADVMVRDYALDRAGGQEWSLRLWTEALRRAEPVHVPSVACVLGFTAWRAGFGALARAAVERALETEPEHNLAGLLYNVLAYGLPPHLLPERSLAGSRGPRFGRRRKAR
ncbi:DUF4192 domain-containing protein [Actinoplanes sp. NPDC051851]|uniref:DUF4192 domain-containing protein n=1 Tax=Actinoplanes sp. NPDC051851 TaxID=3154753 RepID=UPI0034232FE5